MTKYLKTSLSVDYLLNGISTPYGLFNAKIDKFLNVLLQS